MLSINGMPDHIHIFLSLNPVIAISDLVKDIKRASNNWINDKGFIKGEFEWSRKKREIWCIFLRKITN